MAFPIQYRTLFICACALQCSKSWGHVDGTILIQTAIHSRDSNTNSFGSNSNVELNSNSPLARGANRQLAGFDAFSADKSKGQQRQAINADIQMSSLVNRPSLVNRDLFTRETVGPQDINVPLVHGMNEEYSPAERSSAVRHAHDETPADEGVPVELDEVPLQIAEPMVLAARRDVEHDVGEDLGEAFEATEASEVTEVEKAVQAADAEEAEEAKEAEESEDVEQVSQAAATEERQGAEDVVPDTDEKLPEFRIFIPQRRHHRATLDESEDN